MFAYLSYDTTKKLYGMHQKQHLKGRKTQIILDTFLSMARVRNNKMLTNWSTLNLFSLIYHRTKSKVVQNHSNKGYTKAFSTIDKTLSFVVIFDQEEIDITYNSYVFFQLCN